MFISETFSCWASVDLPSIEICAVFFIPVAPDAIHNHVKTYREEQRNMHYIAPEYGGRLPGKLKAEQICGAF